jgi:hypothetical protein
MAASVFLLASSRKLLTKRLRLLKRRLIAGIGGG